MTKKNDPGMAPERSARIEAELTTHPETIRERHQTPRQVETLGIAASHANHRNKPAGSDV
jgi:hypothetical protein